jgi:hypothetical protein
MLVEEWVTFDFFCTIHAKTMHRITGQETGEDASCFIGEFWSELERIIENLVIHGISVLWEGIVIDQTQYPVW